MTDTEQFEIVLDASARRREDRRSFLRGASTVAVVAGAGSLLAACGSGDSSSSPTPTPTPTPTSTASPGTVYTDAQILSFLLNIEYLQAQYYAYATTGTGIPAASIATGTSGTGTPGAVTGGAKVPFPAGSLVQQHALELASDQLEQVNFLRTLIGTTVLPMPNIDISSAGAFTTFAVAAGLISAGQTFNPYADENSFLLGAFLFEDLAVTAYNGATVLLASKTFVEASAGLLAAEGYHAGLVRTLLYNRGYFTQAQQISAYRDSIDGGSFDDQGIGTAAQSNITPADSDGIVFPRSAGQVLNILYGTRNAVVGGLFFPNGVNGAVNTSATS